MDIPQVMIVTGAVGLAVLLLIRLVYPPATVEVGEKGILDRKLHLGWIRWEEIEGAYQPTVHDRDGLRVRLRLTERLLRRLRRRRRLAEGPAPDSLNVRLDLAGADLSPAELLQEIMTRTSARRGRQGS